LHSVLFGVSRPCCRGCNKQDPLMRDGLRGKRTR